MLNAKIPGRGIIIAGEGTLKADQDFEGLFKLKIIYKYKNIIKTN